METGGTARGGRSDSALSGAPSGGMADVTGGSAGTGQSSPRANGGEGASAGTTGTQTQGATGGSSSAGVPGSGDSGASSSGAGVGGTGGAPAGGVEPTGARGASQSSAGVSGSGDSGASSGAGVGGMGGAPAGGAEPTGARGASQSSAGVSGSGHSGASSGAGASGQGGAPAGGAEPAGAGRSAAGAGIAGMPASAGAAGAAGASGCTNDTECSHLTSTCIVGRCNTNTHVCYPDLQNDAPCNDDDPCTSDDVCDSLGVCAGNPYNCNDSLDCTTDVCDGDGGCANTIETGSCLIALACYSDEETNLANTCQICDALTPTSWSDNNGAECDDNDVCTRNDTCSGGTCGGDPIVDSLEDNDTPGTAIDAGMIDSNDWWPSGSYRATLYATGDEDWFSFHDHHANFSDVEPSAELTNVPTNSNYGLCVFYECDDQGDGYTISCAEGAYSISHGLRGCCNSGGMGSDTAVRLVPDCANGGWTGASDNSGQAYVRVFHSAGAWSCASYSLSYGDQ